MPEKEVKITQAIEAEKIAQPLIEKHHDHLAGARILYLFTNQSRTRNLKTVLETAQKLPALHKYLSAATGSINDGADFLMLISSDEWDNLSPKQRIALVDHELCHMWADETGAWKVRGHDLEEFHEILARHGTWRQDVATFAEIARQLRLAEPAGVR